MTQTPNSQGLDTIELIAKYEVFKKMAEKMGLKIQPMAKGHKLYAKLINEIDKEGKARRNKSRFMPIVEVINLPKVSPKDKYLQIVIIKNTPLLFDIATHHKKAKDTYCLISFAGLHQPTKKINSEAMKIISKFLKRKAFKLHRADIATDLQNPRPIDKEGLKAFKEQFKPYSKHWVILPQKNNAKEEKLKTFHTSYYINNLKYGNIVKILYYDKYNKATQKKENVTFKDRHWKRLEIILTFDVTKSKSYSFIEYIKSMEFLEDFENIEEVAKSENIKNYSNNYLLYQLNSLIDNRFLNNRESKKQFNSTETLKFFNESEFRRYVLPI